MNYLLPLIILIILACVYAGSLKNPKSRLTVVVVVLAFILVLCWLQMGGDVWRREGFMGFTGYAPVSGYNMRIDGDDGSSVGCGGYNYADVNSQVGSMGSYDNIEYGDLAASSTYGVVKRDGEDTVVMVDYGLSTEVLNTYYKK